MPEVSVRPARAGDLPAVQDTEWAALSDMHRRHGRPQAPAPEGLAPIWRHLLEHGGGGFWVAEAGGEIVAFANGLQREDNWFLSNYWCRPGWQGQGVGSRLSARLREAMAGAGSAGVYASYDPPAVATYLKLGLRLREPFIAFAPRRGRPVAPPPAWDGDVQEVAALDDATPAVLDDATLAALGALDRPIRGGRRDADHRYWANRPGSRLRLCRRGGALVAYAWVQPEGRVGPIACADPADVQPLLHAAFALGQELAGDQVTLTVPGANAAALEWCLAHGLQVTGHALLLSQPTFGQLDRYILASPALL